MALRRRQRQLKSGQVDGLVNLRSTVLGYGFILAWIGFVVLLLDGPTPETGLSSTTGAALVVTSGLVRLVALPLLRRPLDCTSDDTLAASYRSRLMLRIAFAESSAVVGFVAFFLTGTALMYLLGVAFAAAASVRAVPTAGNLEREQEELVDQGCSRPLVATLRTTRVLPNRMR